MSKHVQSPITIGRDEAERSESTTTITSSRPDISIVYNGMLIYEAEEKSPRSNEKPVDDLKRKLGTWSVVSRGNTKFLLCHTAIGWKVQFYYLTPDARLMPLLDVLDLTVFKDRYTVAVLLHYIYTSVYLYTSLCLMLIFCCRP